MHQKILSRYEMLLISSYAPKKMVEAVSQSNEPYREPQITCSICITPYYCPDEEGCIEFPIITPCGHIFGHKCFDIFIREAYTPRDIKCPCCRFKMKFPKCRQIMPVFQAFSKQTPPTITPGKTPEMCLYCAEEKIIMESTQERLRKIAKEVQEHQEDITRLQSQMNSIRSFIDRQVHMRVPFKMYPLSRSEVTKAIFGTHTNGAGLHSSLIWPHPGRDALDEAIQSVHRRFDDRKDDFWFYFEEGADLIKIFDNQDLSGTILSPLQNLQKLDQKRLEAEKKLQSSKKQFHELNIEVNKLWDRGFDDPVRRNIISWDNVYRSDVYPEVSEWPHQPAS